MKKNKSLYLASVFTTNLGNSLQFIVSGKILYDTSGLVGVFAGAVVLEHIMAIFLSGLSGVVSDRFGDKKVAVFSDLLLALSGVLVAIVFWFEGSSLAIWIGLTIINLMKPFYRTSTFSMVKKLCKNDEYVVFNSKSAAIQQAGYFSGLALAGLLLVYVQAKVLLFVDAASFLLSGILLMNISDSGSTVLPQRILNILSQLKVDFLVVFNFIKIRQDILYLLCLVVSFFIVIDIHNIAIFKIVSERFPNNPSMLSLAEGIYAVGVLSATAMTSRIAFFSQPTIKYFAWVPAFSSGVLFFGFAFVNQTFPLIFLIFLLSLFMSFGFAISLGSIYREIPQEMAGRIGGFRGILLGISAGPVIAGVSYLFDKFSLATGYQFSGLLLIVFSLLMGYSLRV